MDTLDEALTDEVVRSYGAALYDVLLETAAQHCRLPELYEDAAAWPPDEAVVALPVLVDLTKFLREQATVTRELIVSLDHLQVGLRGGFDSPAHWTLTTAVALAGTTTSGTSDMVGCAAGRSTGGDDTVEAPPLGLRPAAEAGPKGVSPVHCIQSSPAAHGPGWDENGS